MSQSINFKILNSVLDFIETTEYDVSKDNITSIKLTDNGIRVKYDKSVISAKKLLESFTKAISINGEYQLIETDDGDTYYKTSIKDQEETMEVSLAVGSGSKKDARICISSGESILDCM